MKNASILNNILLIGLLIIAITGCRKEAAQNTNIVNGSDVSLLTGSDSILKAINPGLIIGEYSMKGSRTVYDGQANQNGDNIKMIIDFFAVKKILPSADKKHLTCPYGEGKYVSKGWKYIIDYDFKNKKLTLSPNEVMAAEIVPGSFETLYAAYDATYNSFTFHTRFTALEDDGDECEVIEPLSKSDE